jgi:hypothetical protein
MAVTSVWEAWLVFNNYNVEGWVRTFLGKGEEEKRETETVPEVVEKPVEKKARWKSVAETSGKEATDVGALADVPLNPLEENEGAGEVERTGGTPVEEFDGSGDVDLKAVDEDVDGTPMNEDIDGVSMEDVDGMPMDDDVDGVPMDDEDVDGVPMSDEDVDGMPMEEGDVDGLPMGEEGMVEEDTQPLESSPENLSPTPEDPPAITTLDPPQQTRPRSPEVPPSQADRPPPQKRQRMKAADMFGE